MPICPVGCTISGPWAFFLDCEVTVICRKAIVVNGISADLFAFTGFKNMK